MNKPLLLSILSILLMYSCSSDNNNNSTQAQASPPPASTQPKTYPTAGSIEHLDPRLDALIPPNAQLEILAEGFEWSEGPLWIEQHQMLLFSDIPRNKVMKWTEKDGASDYLYPSGFTGTDFKGSEPGANGLLLDEQGKVVLCQHGDRRVARMNAAINAPASQFTTLAGKWEGKRFNSPNDAVFSKAGDLFFTDPPYGLSRQMEDEEKEIPFQGVYHHSAATGEVKLLTDVLSRPNGIAFSPDEQTLYVANSDPEKAIWMAFDQKDNTLSNGRIFFDATDKVKTERGLPDGLKVDPRGNIWATGPGGVLIFSADGTQLGTIKTGQATANCAFNADYSSIYLTADMYLMRVKLK